MNYWELRRLVKDLIPRQSKLFNLKQSLSIKEKGRKSNYKQFSLVDKDFKDIKRLLDKDRIDSFLEISLRASACPMPLNLDVWDALRCPYGCKYCFADYFRASLYTSFFDDVKSMGMRHCSPDFYKPKLDELMKYKGQSYEGEEEIKKAISLEIPIRFGIRFEDFHRMEGRNRVSYEMLKYLSELNYPVMINTKSDLLSNNDYLEVLSRNKGKTAVHITLISSDDALLKKLEPGAPSFEARLKTLKTLVDSGIRAVARIEPFMIFINDEEPSVKYYMERLKWAGVKNITFDTYSYSAMSPGIRQNFINLGFDFDRMFLLMSDSQGLGSLLLSYFMKEFQKEGFSCSSFDMGSVSINDQIICCEVGDLFSGFNWGSSVVASRFIKRRNKPVRWKDFENYVIKKGGFLSKIRKFEMKKLWNMAGDNQAYSPGWLSSAIIVGSDEDGLVWRSNSNLDYRLDLLTDLIRREI